MREPSERQRNSIHFDRVLLNSFGAQNKWYTRYSINCFYLCALYINSLYFNARFTCFCFLLFLFGLSIFKINFENANFCLLFVCFVCLRIFDICLWIFVFFFLDFYLQFLISYFVCQLNVIFDLGKNMIRQAAKTP